MNNNVTFYYQKYLTYPYDIFQGIQPEFQLILQIYHPYMAYTDDTFQGDPVAIAIQKYIARM